MTERERVEAQNVSMYPQQWELVKEVAVELASLTGGPPQVSVALRKIISEWDGMRRQMRLSLDERTRLD